MRAAMPAQGGESSSAPATGGWSDDLLLAVMDASPERICAVLDANGKPAINCVLLRHTIGGRPVFILDDQVYVRQGSLRDVLGGNFEFEREQLRDQIARWLEMLQAANGDTLMHILMRVNGIDDMHKARCAVEILGRGAPWENQNADGVIASQIDPAGFKWSWLKELPAWKENQQRLKRERQAKERQRKASAAEEQRREAQKIAAQRRQELLEQLRAEAKTKVAEEEERLKYHKRLNQSLERLEAKEQRLAKVNPAFTELMADVRAVPGRIERWLRDHKVPGFY